MVLADADGTIRGQAEVGPKDVALKEDTITQPNNSESLVVRLLAEFGQGK